MTARGGYGRAMLGCLGTEYAYRRPDYTAGPVATIEVRRIRSQALGTNLSLVLLAIAIMHDQGYNDVSAALVFRYVGCSKSTAARHMKTLAELGYLFGYRSGRAAWYRVDWTTLDV